MEESFRNNSKNNKGKRLVKYCISESKENKTIITVKSDENCIKIVKIDKLWALWYSKQGPRGRKDKTSILIVINKTSGKRRSNKVNRNKVFKNKSGNLKLIIENSVKKSKVPAAGTIGAHSKISKSNPNLIGFYGPSLPIGGLGKLKTNKINPNLIGFYRPILPIGGLGKLSRSPQTGFYRLLLPKLEYWGSLREIKFVLIRSLQA